MIYYAIKDKESGKWLVKINGEYMLKEELGMIDWYLYDSVAQDIIEKASKDIDTTNLVIVPMELKEVIDAPQEQAREYFTKAMLDNRVYLPVKESKPKWYEIRPNTMVRLNKVDGFELSSCEKYVGKELGRELNKKFWRIFIYGKGINCCTDYLTEEEATAKYNELKKLLEEV